MTQSIGLVHTRKTFVKGKRENAKLNSLSPCVHGHSATVTIADWRERLGEFSGRGSWIALGQLVLRPVVRGQ